MTQRKCGYSRRQTRPDMKQEMPMYGEDHIFLLDMVDRFAAHDVIRDE